MEAPQESTWDSGSLTDVTLAQRRTMDGKWQRTSPLPLLQRNPVIRWENHPTFTLVGGLHLQSLFDPRTCIGQEGALALTYVCNHRGVAALLCLLRWEPFD